MPSRIDTPATIAAQAAEEAPRPDHGPQAVARLFEMANDPLATVSMAGQFVLLNSAWESVLGWSLDELKETSFADLIHPDDLEQSMALLATGREHAARITNFTNRLRHRDGSWRWLLWSGRCDGELWYASVKDVTDRMWLERQALHDPLTRLPNRLLLLDRAHQALTRQRRSAGPVALLFIDLDSFKAVNDSLGHATGDELLIAVSERLREAVRDSDTVARLGGDEFVVLAEDLESDGEALTVAERVLYAFERPFATNSSEVTVTASVGVSISHDSEEDTEGLLREADVAMYRAKRSGGNSLEVFDENLRQEVRNHVDVEHSLRGAVAREELLLHYQPVLRLADRRAVSCEALVRWSPDGVRLIPASAFMGIAEQSELIYEMGQWAVAEAAAEASAWRRRGLRMEVWVNVSPRGLTEFELVPFLSETLVSNRLPAEALSVEVSERAIMRDPVRSRAALEAVAKLGVKVVLDNFGVGSPGSGSSLGLAASLPLSAIKLDRSLVQGFEQDRLRRATIMGVLAYARHAGLETVAVGIESERQLELLEEMGCTLGQGFLLQRPGPARELREELDRL